MVDQYIVTECHLNQAKQTQHHQYNRPFFNHFLYYNTTLIHHQTNINPIEYIKNSPIQFYSSVHYKELLYREVLIVWGGRV